MDCFIDNIPEKERMKIMRKLLRFSWWNPLEAVWADLNLRIHTVEGEQEYYSRFQKRVRVLIKWCCSISVYLSWSLHNPESPFSALSGLFTFQSCEKNLEVNKFSTIIGDQPSAERPESCLRLPVDDAGTKKGRTENLVLRPAGQFVDYLDIKIGQTENLFKRIDGHRRTCVGEELIWCFAFRSNNCVLLEHLVHLSLTAWGAKRMPYLLESKAQLGTVG
ncbi:hypothetical protein C8R43DRAFT_958343 [Mycena crocata]|nr:hypothetical protein C8R43DRAFT_958343 [Mycena crocata]